MPKPLLIALACFALAACNRETAAIRKAVPAYNDALISAFRTGDLEGIRRTAGAEEAKKIEALVDLKRAGGFVLESELTSFAIDAIDRVGPDGANVRTSETWRYHDRALTPGTPPGTKFVARMTMQYSMERRDGHWYVTQVRTLTNEFLEPRGYRAPAAVEEGKNAHGASH
ncbi:MAG: hypothetical protein ACYC7A_08895 [Thermoanaerobaculia bacterium]